MSHEEPARRVARVTKRGGGARPRGQHLKGFRYDEAACLAYFSVYLPGGGGDDRRRATVEAATWEEAVEKWTEFRARALKGEARAHQARVTGQTTQLSVGILVR